MLRPAAVLTVPICCVVLRLKFLVRLSRNVWLVVVMGVILGMLGVLFSVSN